MMTPNQLIVLLDCVRGFDPDRHLGLGTLNDDLADLECARFIEPGGGCGRFVWRVTEKGRALADALGFVHASSVTEARAIYMQPDVERPTHSDGTLKYGDDYFWDHIISMEARKDQPNVPGVPTEAVTREQANRICLNVRALVKELEERDASFELRWGADMRAIERWRAERPEERDLIHPDHADLCVWLMKRLYPMPEVDGEVRMGRGATTADLDEHAKKRGDD